MSENVKQLSLKALHLPAKTPLTWLDTRVQSAGRGSQPEHSSFLVKSSYSLNKEVLVIELKGAGCRVCHSLRGPLL